MFGYWQYGTESLVSSWFLVFSGSAVAVHIDGFGEPWQVTWYVPTIAELEGVNLAVGRTVSGVTPPRGLAAPRLLAGHRCCGDA